MTDFSAKQLAELDTALTGGAPEEIVAAQESLTVSRLNPGVSIKVYEDRRHEHGWSPFYVWVVMIDRRNTPLRVFEFPSHETSMFEAVKMAEQEMVEA